AGQAAAERAAEPVAEAYREQGVDTEVAELVVGSDVAGRGQAEHARDGLGDGVEHPGRPPVCGGPADGPLGGGGLRDASAERAEPQLVDGRDDPPVRVGGDDRDGVRPGGGRAHAQLADGPRLVDAYAAPGERLERAAVAREVERLDQAVEERGVQGVSGGGAGEG